MITVDLTWVLNTKSGIAQDTLNLIRGMETPGIETGYLLRRWQGVGLDVGKGEPNRLAVYMEKESGLGRVLGRLPGVLQRRFDAGSSIGKMNSLEWRTFLARFNQEIALLFQESSKVQVVAPSQEVVVSNFRRNKKTEIRSDASIQGPIIFSDVVAPVCKAATGIYRFHDAIPELHPNLVSPWHGVIHGRALALHASRGLLLPVSQTAINQLHQVFGSAPEFFVPNAIDYPTLLQPQDLEDLLVAAAGFQWSDSRLAPAECSGILQRVKHEPTALVIAPFEPKKDLATFFKGFVRHRTKSGSGLAVVVAGEGWAAAADRRWAAAAEAEGNCVVLSDVPDRILQALLQSSDVLVSPSLVEGFGRPPIEGLSAGLNVVVSDIPAHREFVGDFGDYFEVGDWRQLSEVLTHNLRSKLDQGQRRSAREALIDWLSVFRPEAVSVKLTKVLEDVMT